MTTDADRTLWDDLFPILHGAVWGAFSALMIAMHCTAPPHKEHACKDACFPVVGRRIASDCYCAEGKNWEFKATDEELENDDPED